MKPRAVRVDLRSVFSEAPSAAGRPIPRILRNGEEVTWIRLTDDGADGDAEAGDGVFTSLPLVPEQDDPPPLFTYYPLAVRALGWEFEDTTVVRELEAGSRFRLQLWDIDTGEIPLPDVVDLADDARR